MSATSRSVAAKPWTVWLLAARPATLTAAIAPVLVGGAGGTHDGQFRPLPFVGALLAALLIQIGTNLANDVFDFERGVDTSGRLGPPRVTQSRLASPEQVRLATGVAFGLAAAVGVYLVVVGGWPILIIGALSIAAGLAYTAGPWPLGYHGLGDLFVFAFFGLAAVVGTYYLQTGEMAGLAFASAVPVGLTVTAILVVNNLRDIASDREAGKRTLAVRLGPRLTRVQYTLLFLGAYALVPLVQVAGGEAWVWLSWLTLPVAALVVWAVLRGAAGAALNPVLKRTAQIHLAFGSLLALGLLL